MRTHPHRRACTLVDLVVCLVVIAILGVLALAGLSGSRAASQLTLCTAKLGAIGAGSGQFALSNNGLMAGLTTGAGTTNNQAAHAAQAVDIMRRRGRPDMPAISGWIPDVSYWSLSLVDFENRALSDPFNICPAHDTLGKWRRQAVAFDAGAFLPNQPSPTSVNKRQPYQSSYHITGGAFDVNQNIPATSSSSPVATARLYQGGSAHNLYAIPASHTLGPSAMSPVALPSQKVHAFDQHQRHFSGQNLYFMYADARVPVLFFDGSVSVRRTGDARDSWSPNFPTSLAPTQVFYQPQAWEPPTASGQGFETVTDRYRWTRDGLLGWDFQN